MKFNWGWGIVLALALFVAMILQFVFRSFDQRIDLVTEDYYEQELGYQETMDKEENLNALEGDMKVQNSPEGLRIVFPAEIDLETISGKVQLYRPSDERLDKNYVFEGLDGGIFLIPVEDLIGGKWVIKVDFESEGVPYYYKKEIML